MSDSTRRILFVLTNHDTLGDTGKPTGAFLAEAAHPYAVVTEAGYTVDFASPKGGSVPFDPGSLEDLDDVARGFHEDPAIQERLASTLAPHEVRGADYAAIFFAGGHGTMWDFPDDPGLQALTREIYEAGGVVGAVCHGPSALTNVRLGDGHYLVAGHEISAFTTAEEEAVGLDGVVPFLLDRRLAERGAHHRPADPFTAQVVTDGYVVTGQNPASSQGVGEAMVNVLRRAGVA